jgi:hypothetical protein
VNCELNWRQIGGGDESESTYLAFLPPMLLRAVLCMSTSTQGRTILRSSASFDASHVGHQFHRGQICPNWSQKSFTYSHKMTSFFTKLEARVQEVNSLLCVGLDPHSKEIQNDSLTTPQDKCDAAFTFCKTLIDATLPYAACYKPNAAFFEALGEHGQATLERVIKEIPSNVPVLLDVKRGDIGSTASAYAEACYEHAKADAVTLSPLMGWDSVAPFVTGTSEIEIANECMNYPC